MRWGRALGVLLALVAAGCSETSPDVVADAPSKREICNELLSRQRSMLEPAADGGAVDLEGAERVGRDMIEQGCGFRSDPPGLRPPFVPFPDGSLSDVPMVPKRFGMFGSPQPAYGIAGAFRPRGPELAPARAVQLYDFYRAAMPEAGYVLEEDTRPDVHGSWRQLWARAGDLVRLQAFTTGRDEFLVYLCPPAANSECVRTSSPWPEVGSGDWPESET